MQSSNPLQLEQASVYLFQGQRCRSMPANRWYLAMKAHLLHLTDRRDQQVELGQQVVRIVYSDTQGFFIKCGKAYFVLHLPLHHAQEEAFEYKLAENGVTLTEWGTASKDVQKEIKKVCRSCIDQDPCITGKSIGSEITYKIGGVFGAINNFFSRPAEKVDKGFQEGKEEAKDKVLNEERKSNWQIVKDKAKEINKGAVEAIKPLKNKMSEVKKDIGEKFENSDNTAVKGIREFGYNLRDSLNDGYTNFRFSKEEDKDEAEGPKQEGTAPPAQQPAAMQAKGPQSDRNLQ